MDVYILDTLFRRTQVVDKYVSFIWTERYSDIGDFQLVIKSNASVRSMFKPNVFLTIRESTEVMRIETLEDSVDENGEMLLTVKGYTLCSLMNDRLYYAASGPVLFTDTPSNVVYTMINEVCVLGASTGPVDIYPQLIVYVGYPTGDIPYPSDVINWSQDNAQLIDPVKQICSTYNIGFRTILLENPNRSIESIIILSIYMGSNRTAARGADALSTVVFSADLDNLQNTTNLKTIDNAKNVAYATGIYSDGTAGPSLIQNAPGVSGDPSGYDRRIMYLEVDIPDTITDPLAVVAYIQQKATEALIATGGSALFDGELNEADNYVYNTDYELGDLVEFRDLDRNVYYKTITEQIFSCDENGTKAYPTIAEVIYPT